MVGLSYTFACAAMCVSVLVMAEILLGSLQFLPPGPSQVLQVADALCVQLSSRELLGNTEGDDEGGETREALLVPSSGCQTSSTNPLLISC